MVDATSGGETLVADPRLLLAAGDDDTDLPAAERARRERLREAAGGVTSFATDAAVTVDRDLTGTPDAPCFEKIALLPPRTLEITYSKDRVNAGEVLAAVQASGLGIVDVSTREPDLEDVFLSLTRAANAR